MAKETQVESQSKLKDLSRQLLDIGLYEAQKFYDFKGLFDKFDTAKLKEFKLYSFINENI